MDTITDKNKIKTVILIGMPGVGKSSIGKKVAKDLGLDFVDVDVLIEAEIGSGLQEFIDKEGEPAFLRLEERLIRELEKSNKILAPGGSLIYNQDLITELKSSCLFVYLKDSVEAIQNRVHNLNDRGIIGLSEGGFTALYEERRPLYEKHADAIIDFKGKTWADLHGELKKIVSDLIKNKNS